MHAFAAVRDAIASVHPDAPWVALCLAIWCVQWLCRRYAPSLWAFAFSWVPADAPDMARRIAQGLPSVVAGAAVSALASGGDVKQATVGAVFGACAPLLHHFLKAMPNELVPYTGALGAGVPPTDGDS